MNTTKIQIDPAKVEAFLGRFVNDCGAALSIVLSHMGDKLGLYKAMSKYGSMNSAELAEKTNTTERYVREWLINQAAGGYIDYNTDTGKYSLPIEHAIALTDENSPFFIAGGFQVITAATKAEERITEAFKNGKGMLWGEHHHHLFEGTERFFKPGYIENLTANWLPSLEGVADKLAKGAKAADIGCGHGISTIIMAKAYPDSHFYGFDNHEPSILKAQKIAKNENLTNVTFQTAASDNFPGKDYDLIAYFDCLHDMGNPANAVTHAANVIAKDGTVMMVEPMAGKTVDGNFNPVGRIYSGASVLICTPNAVASGDVNNALGTVASDDNLKEVFKQGGFTKFRRATETPFNRVFEARL
jgi:2-polyprenyl-3-methyl-5-hydroxy-6-metoxy-1,4-benzoquinol methylase